MCFYDEDEDGNQYMRLQVSDKKILAKAPVGTRAKFQVSGEITEVEAPKMVRDYSVEYDRSKSKKPPMKERPGRVHLKLDKGDPDIELLNSMLLDEEMD